MMILSQTLMLRSQGQMACKGPALTGVTNGAHVATGAHSCRRGHGQGTH